MTAVGRCCLLRMWVWFSSETRSSQHSGSISRTVGLLSALSMLIEATVVLSLTS